MSKYRLVFKGGLMEGFDQEQCLTGLAKMFKEDRETLRQRLFSGRRVVVQRTDDEERVRQFVMAFEKAGGVLNIETSGLDYDRPGGEGELHGAIDTHSTRKRPALRPAGEHVPRPGPVPARTSGDEQVTEQRDAVSELDLTRREKRRRRRGKRK